jgi:Ca-activated chloride channel family protein
MLKQPKNARELADIQFALDVSGSMSSENRYEMATDAIEKFITQREGDAFGLTMFGSRQIRWMPLTKDMDAIRNSLPFANPENQPLHMSGTLIGAALRFCKDNMLAESTGGDRMIILVSDGQSADIDGDEGADIAQELADEKISVYHVHVARDDVPQEVIDLAEATGGEAFQAADPESLSKVFRHIDRMRPAKFNPAGTVPMDHFRPFALAGVALLALHVAGLMGLRYTPW